MATTKNIDYDKEVVLDHKWSFIVSGALILIGLILMFIHNDKFVAAWAAWLFFLVLSASLAGFTYYWAYRESSASAHVGGAGKKDLRYGFLIGAWLFYALAIYSQVSNQRTNRVENCWPEKSLALTGQSGQGQEWLDFYLPKDCHDVLLDEPAQSYIRSTSQLPSWIMTRNGITPDPVGWYKYYSVHPADPYQAKSWSREELNEFYNTRQLAKERLQRE